MNENQCFDLRKQKPIYLPNYSQMFDLNSFDIQKPPSNTNPKPAPPAPPVSNNVGPVSSIPAILQPFANNATARRPNGLSGLLGSNPEDVLKNMEVARRTV